MKFIRRLIANFTKNPHDKEKKLADINGEPWVRVIDVSFEDPTKPGIGAFELDWNDEFVKMLVDSGYSGKTANEIVNTWFNDVCRGVLEDDDVT